MASVEFNGKRYASLADHEAGRAMTPRELVEDVIRRQTDGTLTFRVEEDDHSVVALLLFLGQRYAATWSKEQLAGECSAADFGLRRLLARAGEPAPA